MTTEKQKLAWQKDGGLHSANCKCGRRWYTYFIGSGRYYRICSGCDNRVKDCLCAKNAEK